MTQHDLKSSAPVDPSQLLRLTSEPARIVMALFVFSNFLYTFATLDLVTNPWGPIVAAILVGGASVLLVVDRPDPFPLLFCAAILAAVALSTVLVAFSIPGVDSPGRAGWHLGSNTWLLFFLAMRRRPGWAWAGYAVMAALTIWWAATTGRGVATGVALLDTHAAILFVGTMFQVNARRTAVRINEFDERALGAAIDTAEASTAAHIRRRRLMELRSEIAPLLERLVASGPPTTEAERVEYATAEAALRDGVRGRSLMTPQVSHAATAARARGVEVVLLDDRGRHLAHGGAIRKVNDEVRDALERADRGSVTVRLAPDGRSAAVSIVTAHGDQRDRVELDDDGNRLETKKPQESETPAEESAP